MKLLAIDPGREKSGLAILDRRGEVLAREVVATPQLPEKVAEFLRLHEIGEVILGNGTNHRRILEEISPLCEAHRLSVVVAEEGRSSERARRLYFEENPPRGWRRLLPLSLQTPPVPYDDYGAIIIARDYLAQKPSSSSS